MRTCRTCNGTGKVDGHGCPWCDGDGIEMEEKGHLPFEDDEEELRTELVMRESIPWTAEEGRTK